MPPRYFQGSKVTDPVKASAARTFREVVDCFRVCAPIGMTRPAFLALHKDDRDQIKRVPFFVPACFNQSPSKRIYAEATHCNLLFVDIDTANDAKPFYHHPDSLYLALAGFNFGAYTTANSTEEKPRLRIVIDAEAIPVKAYPRAVLTIGALLGLKVNTESKVAVQPMFLPTLFSDSTEDDHPLIAYHLEGCAFTVDDISDDLFPEYSEPKQNADAGSDSLHFLRAPVPEITLAIAKEALDAVDADCSYFEWLEIAAALRHQFSPRLAEEAYHLFDEWSATGSKYGGEEDTRKKWDSIRQTPSGRMPVTIRSLLRQAVASGWDDKKVKESSFNAVLRWIEEVENVTELMEKGVRKILATPLLSAVQEDILIHELCKTAKKTFAFSITATSIRKDLNRVKAEMKAAEKSAEKLPEPKWAKGVLFIAAPGDFYRHRTGEKYKGASFDAIYGRHLLPTEEGLKDSGEAITPASLSTPIVSPADYALNHLKITTVYDYAYDPSQPGEVFFVNRGRRYVNTYSPTYPELDDKNASLAGALFQRHLRNLILEAENRTTLTDFMAFMVQSPGRKIRWAVLIQSVEGAGKTYLAEIMKSVLGAEHVQTIDGAAIKSGWNEWAFGRQLVVLEEVRVSGANRHEIMNTLKPLITNDDISVNERFRNNRQVTNISNYMLFSNHHDALALTPGDRRYFVIKSPLQHKAQVLALGENYFPPLYNMLRDHPGAMRAWLNDWEISPDFRADGHAPRTKYVQDLINDSASDATAAVRRLLLEGDDPLVQYDIVSTAKLMELLQLESGLGRATGQHVAQILREEGFHQIGRHLLGSERHYLWIRSGMVESEAVADATDRLRTGKKNLSMEIIYL